MSHSAYLFLGLTVVVAALTGVLAFSVMKFFAAARAATRASRVEGAETAFMAAAMEEAVRKLRNEERAMKARAEASERLSSEIIAGMTSGLLVVGADGSVRTLNPAARALLGIPDDGVTGHYREVLGSSTALADVVEECLASGRPIVRRTVQVPGRQSGTLPPHDAQDASWEPRLPPHDVQDASRGPRLPPHDAQDASWGARLHLGVTVSPIRDAAGLSSGAICLFTDLSDVVELEEQLRLKDSLARLGELTAGIAHEFRNGLATIHGYSRLLDLDRLPDEFRPYVTGIRDETEALGQVVTNFLNFARPAELVLTPVDMRSVAARAAEEVRGEARSRGGEICLQGEFAQVDGDEVLLRQAFSNLCRNALEACILARVTPRITIDAAIDRTQKLLRIAVTDNGPGIDAALVSRLFSPFVTTRDRGTGLGLALVQKIVVTHNGRVTAGNADGGGARLVVTLPLRAA